MASVSRLVRLAVLLIGCSMGPGADVSPAGQPGDDHGVRAGRNHLIAALDGGSFSAQVYDALPKMPTRILGIPLTGDQKERVFNGVRAAYLQCVEAARNKVGCAEQHSTAAVEVLQEHFESCLSLKSRSYCTGTECGDEACLEEAVARYEASLVWDGMLKANAVHSSMATAYISLAARALDACMSTKGSWDDRCERSGRCSADAKERYCRPLASSVTDERSKFCKANHIPMEKCAEGWEEPSGPETGGQRFPSPAYLNRAPWVKAF